MIRHVYGNKKSGSCTHGIHYETDKSDELLAEVQRLMAFLSASARSYASVGALMNTEAIKSSSPEYATPSGTRLELLLQNWTLAASTKSATAGDELCLFNTTIGTNSAEGLSTSNRSLIDMPVNISQDGKSDLLEQLDQLLWDAKISGEDVSENYIHRPADVLVIRAHQQNPTAAPQLRLEVPAEFYVDKYLPENGSSAESEPQPRSHQRPYIHTATTKMLRCRVERLISIPLMVSPQRPHPPSPTFRIDVPIRRIITDSIRPS